MRRRNFHLHQQTKGRRHRCRCHSSSAAAAVIIFSSCFLLWAHHHSVSGFLCRAKAILLDVRSTTTASHFIKASNAVNVGNRNGKKRIYEKQYQQQLRRKELGSSNFLYRPSLSHRMSPNNDNINHKPTFQQHQNNINEEDEVPEWLLRSTSLILGEELTLKLINGHVDDRLIISQERISSSSSGSDDDDDDDQNNQKLPPHFSTNEDFILNAESVMRAWCQWISRCSNTGSVNNNNLSSLDDDGGVIITRCSSINAAKIVDAILNRVLGVIGERTICEGEEECDMGRVDWEIQLVELVSCAIDAWANTKNRDGEAVTRAEGWLAFFQQRLSQQKDGGNVILSEGLLGSANLSDNVLRLYEECYRGVIKACIRSHERKYLGKAIELLEDLRVQQNTSLAESESVRFPATKTYNLVLYGLANCEPCEKNAEQAEKLLEEMISCKLSSCAPDSNTFRQVITAWTKSGTVAAAENARRILDQVLSDDDDDNFPTLDPDASTFNALMTLYLKLGKTEETLSLFDLMTSMHQSGRTGIKPDIYSVNLMLKAMAKQPSLNSLEDMVSMEHILENIEERYHVHPDVNSYNLILDAYAKSDLREAATRAELLLECMERKCRTDRNVAPDAYSFTSTINAIERSRYHKARGSWAEKVFLRMRELNSQGLVESPTTPVYNSLLNALITSQESGSLWRAEELFADIEAAGLANSRTYNTMLKGYAVFVRSRDDGRIISPAHPHKAEKLLSEMEYSYFSEGLASAIIPDKYSYTTVISAYGRSGAQRKAANALDLLHRMIDSYEEGNSAARPGTYAFNAVLNACAHTRNPEERLEAFTILCSTLILQSDWARPDHTTYGTFLQACARLLPRDEARKWSVVETVFNSCVREGLCGDLVLKNLKGVASPELYDALVGRFLTDDGLDIPMKWRRNVVGKRGDSLVTINLDSKK